MTDPAIEDASEMAEPFEGFSATPYRDPAGVWTIGFGSTRDVAGNPVTENTVAIARDQALALVERDMIQAGREVALDVHVPLTENERAALDDFVYNLGAGNFRASTLLRRLNAGDLAGAADEFLRWDRAGGQVLAGLLRRREAERAEFLKPTDGTTA